MSLKDSTKKPNQSNWTNLPKNAKKQLNFNRNHQSSSFKTLNYIDPQYSSTKIIQKKHPPHVLHDSRSSSTINFYPKGKSKTFMKEKEIRAFVLFFEPIPSDVKKISLIEPDSNWKFLDIDLSSN